MTVEQIKHAEEVVVTAGLAVSAGAGIWKIAVADIISAFFLWRSEKGRGRRLLLEEERRLEEKKNGN